MGLETYRKKRRFEKTPEPSGQAGEPTPSGGGEREPRDGPRLLYVIQKHAATRLHYDFRLELDGVLVSWAVPKGPSLDPHDRRLAVHVEDHPVEYGSFEGTIPKGEYGGGTVELWDRGTWEPEVDPRKGLEKGELKFTLHGEKLKGSWVLVRTKGRPGEDKEQWLLIKHRDDYSVDGDGQAVLREQAASVASGRTLDEIAAEGEASVWHGDQPPDRQADVRAAEEFLIDPSALPGARRAPELPRFVSPELATLVERAPEGPGWLHEVKFDGYRALARIEQGSAVMYSRNNKDWTGRYQVLVDSLAALPVESAMLDGEVVVQLPDGTTSFQELQNLAGAGERPANGRLVYFAFDLLYLDGWELLAVAIEDRKRLLKRLLSRVAAGDRIVYSDDIAGDGAVVLESACGLGLEGVVSKRTGSRYRPGVRGTEWVKVKCRHEQEFVVGGYTDPAGTRVGFGGLLLGVHGDGELRYVGKVGTGFSEQLLLRLGERLRGLRTDEAPFADLKRLPKGSHWVEPRLVAQVAFAEWTGDGRIRHPSFKGLREDKASDEVGREPAAPAAVSAVTVAAAGTPAAVAGSVVAVTHPDRVFWPAQGVTKRGLIDYYQSVARWMMPYVVDRPVSMVRCPDGVKGSPDVVGQGGEAGGQCFFHKHPGQDFPGPFRRITIEESGGVETYIAITEPDSLVALAQMGVLEVHIWGSTWPDIERPDMLVFDLDPDPAVGWHDLAEAARLMRETLRVLGLQSFVKTTGGKGLHVVAPIIPGDGWQAVRGFCKAVAETFVSVAPDKYTANMSKAKRPGKIYVDYVRNTRGATSIAPYSTRARENATVSVPLRWSELGGRVRPDSYTIATLPNRLRRLKGDPWEGYFDARDSQRITPQMKQALGLS